MYGKILTRTNCPKKSLQTVSYRRGSDKSFGWKDNAKGKDRQGQTVHKKIFTDGELYKREGTNPLGWKDNIL